MITNFIIIQMKTLILKNKLYNNVTKAQNNSNNYINFKNYDTAKLYL